MCRSMVDIQSPTADIRRGKKKRKERKKEETGWKYIWSALLHRATIKDSDSTDIFLNQLIQFYSNNATNLHHLSTHSTTCWPTKWRSHCDHIYVTSLQPMYKLYLLTYLLTYSLRWLILCSHNFSVQVKNGSRARGRTECENNKYKWIHLQDRNDGSLETRLYIGKALEHHFRSYSVVAENRIGIASARVQLTHGLSALQWRS